MKSLLIFPQKSILFISVLFLAESFRVSAMENSKLEVGTYCASAPYGITMLVNREVAFVIDPEADFDSTRFISRDEATASYGTCAPDGSYFNATLNLRGSKYNITWGKINDHAVGAILTSDHAMTVALRFLQPFSGCKTLYWANGDGLKGEGISTHTQETVLIQVHAQPAQVVTGNYSTQAQIDCKINPAQPTILVFSIGDQPSPSFDSVQPTLNAARVAYQARRITAEGDWGDYLSPIADVMNGSRFFSSQDRRVSHSVGRGWWISHQWPINGNADLEPYFGWDSFFNADMAALEDPETARDTVRAVLSLQAPDGMIANFSHWAFQGEYVSAERTDPPVGALCVWKLYQRWPDKAFLEEIYPKLVKWHDWFHQQRARSGDFLLSWGSAKGDYQDARWETGWDDTVSFGDGAMVGTLINQYNVDLNSLWAMDAENLAYLAHALGKTQDEARFQDEHAHMVKEMNDRLWNENLGLYCNRSWNDNPDGSPHFITRITPMNFYPLIAGVPDSARAKRVLDCLHNPKKFWGNYLIPTLPYDDPDYHEQSYWHGHTWAPVNYLILQGLLRYDDAQHIGELTQRSVSLFMNGWKNKGICSENYRSDTGNPDNDPHYTWGALLPLIGVESLVDIGPDLKPVPRKTALKESITLRRIPIGGELYQINLKNGVVTVEKK